MSISKETGQGGLPCVRVTNPHAEAVIYLHGAHITHYQPKGKEPVLWLSRQSFFDKEKPIRGGIPICWPWFGPNALDQALPPHGFARLMDWTLERAEELPDGSTFLMFRLDASEATLKLWPHAFRLEYEVIVGPELDVMLRSQNAGTTPFRYEEALHSYFRVADIRHIKVLGLEGVEYLDKTRDGKRTPQSGPIAFTEETDRVFLNTSHTCWISASVPGASERPIYMIGKKGSHATVVWNPWTKKAQAMKDFGDDEWPGMLCVETANVGSCARELAPNHSHAMTARINAHG